MINLLVYLGLYISNPSLHICREGKILELTTYNNLLLENDDLDYKSGYNEAQFNHPDDSKDKLYEIKEIFHKKKLLLLLESNNISEKEKLEIISRDINPLSYVPSITAGGLMDDWEFDLHKE